MLNIDYEALDPRAVVTTNIQSRWPANWHVATRTTGCWLKNKFMLPCFISSNLLVPLSILCRYSNVSLGIIGSSSYLIDYHTLRQNNHIGEFGSTELADNRSTTQAATQPLRLSPAELDYPIHYIMLQTLLVVFLFSIVFSRLSW
jgi:hypothetical protein